MVVGVGHVDVALLVDDDTCGQIERSAICAVLAEGGDGVAVTGFGTCWLSERDGFLQGKSRLHSDDSAVDK